MLDLRHVALAALLAAAVQERVNGEDLRAGLVAVYRGGGAELHRIDARPAFTLGASSPHPRIPPGPFEAEWTGLLLVQEADTIAFDAAVGGELRLEVDGVTVLEGAASKPLERRPGLYRFRARFRSKEGVPARLQIGWSGGTFSREPLPPWRLKHLATEVPEAVKREALAERGRAEAARLGCARCHPSGFATAPPPGPSLAGLERRMSRAAVFEHLGGAHGRMTGLFAPGPAGIAERRLIAETLGGEPVRGQGGDHRLGKRDFQSVGCVACHFVPDLDRDEQEPLGRTALEGANDRWTLEELTAFLLEPHSRYPDGRMPRIPLKPEGAKNLAAYVLVAARPAAAAALPEADTTALAARLGAEPGKALLREKRCGACHEGLDAPAEVPLRTPGAECRAFRFASDAAALSAHVDSAAKDRHPSAFEDGRRRLQWLGCHRCHARDSDRPPPLEVGASTLGGAYLQYVPFLKTPRLTDVHAKYAPEYLRATLKDGVAGVRHSRFSYRMPSFGAEAEAIVRALAEAEGALPDAPAPPARPIADPTAANVGPSLVGFEGYSCVSCHVWAGKMMNEPDPGAIGPELTSVTTRIRREWFERWVEDPSRLHPGTPMPQIFKKGQPATLKNLLEGDAEKQKEALWAYLSKGKDAPSPKPLPALAVEGPLVAQIPLLLPDRKVVEGLCVLTADHDLLVFDVGGLRLHSAYVGARLLRTVRGRIRGYAVQGTPVPLPELEALAGPFLGYERAAGGARILGAGGAAELRTRGRTLLWKGREVALPPAAPPPPHELMRLTDSLQPEGSLERPGYRAIAYPRPKTATGEDLVMPGAVAAHPRDGRVFVASMKRGELFTVEDPTDDGREARFVDYTGGLFQEAYSMMAESDGLYVLHRRNLTKVVDSDGDGQADRFERVFALPHGIADTYDYGYGLARDREGAFVLSYAPYANRKLPGSGGMLRWVPGKEPEEVAYGFRNPVGWTAGPDGDVYYTDNQGEWVATNKLCAIVPGRFYGFPNPEQRQHAQKPAGKAAVWVPYAWARSINGVTFNASGATSGPFGGQFFLAELMYGGGIVRAAVEKVNGEVQGSCFPFWGKGLLGPVTLAFDPKGRLWVGSITEPGWMAQPDRGALFRIDFTGETPFEIREIRVLPDGFRLHFTLPVDPKTAADAASYAAEHWRYEYTGSYGSPELDKTRVEIAKATVSADARSVDLAMPLVKDRVYLITARGVRSPSGAPLVHPLGSYTLNEIPR
jgi:cytochrome c2